MTYRGHIERGEVKLDTPLDLPEGTPVTVQPARLPQAPRRRRRAPAAPTSWGRLLLKYAGRAEGLPTDLARRHDHYLYGTPPS